MFQIERARAPMEGFHYAAEWFAVVAPFKKKDVFN